MTSATRDQDPNQHGELSESSELSPHGDFDPEQVAMLQDLARNGAPEAQIYGYSGAGAHDDGPHINGYGDTSSNGMHSSQAPNPANNCTDNDVDLLQSQQDLDLDDPAALLESLANYEHPPQTEVQISNDHFESLLQAAATAGGQEAAQGNRAVIRRSNRQSRPAGLLNAVQKHAPERRAIRQQNGDSGTSDTEGFIRTSKKRKRLPIDDTDGEEQLAREREIWGSEEPEDDDNSFDENQYVGAPIATSDARAAGVHSAAALFRRPSIASKKYTRPPMSKLFTSLELTPEEFLHLQAAAKIYMLDPNHPERRDCIGNRGRGDNDMVKLKLFGCVKLFLEDEGWGDRCFGPGSGTVETRKVKWPQMKNKIISLVTPLLRRMVTNERQRQYAVGARKSALSSAKTGSKKPKVTRSTPPPGASQQAPVETGSPCRYPEIDPKLDQYHYNPSPSFNSTTATGADNEPNPGITPGDHNNHNKAETLVQAQPEPFKVLPTYHINILADSRRIRPSYTFQPSACPEFLSVVQNIRSALSDESAQIRNMQVLTPDGLKGVVGEEGWRSTIKSVIETEWMDGAIRVLANVDVDPDGGDNDHGNRNGLGHKDDGDSSAEANRDAEAASLEA